MAALLQSRFPCCMLPFINFWAVWWRKKQQRYTIKIGWKEHSFLWRKFCTNLFLMVMVMTNLPALICQILGGQQLILLSAYTWNLEEIYQKKYKSFGTLSKTTHFPSVVCEADVVQQCTEAQAGMVRNGLTPFCFDTEGASCSIQGGNTV